MAPKRRTTRLNPETTLAATAATTTTITNAQLQAMIDQGVTTVLAALDANTNGVDNHNSGTCARRNERATRSGIFNDHIFNKYTANNLPLRGGHSIMDPSCDVLSLGALYSWEFLLKFHLHACDLGS
ncbi:hypothetical protein Tco_1496102 [Tanacetum coccineum]